MGKFKSNKTNIYLQQQYLFIISSFERVMSRPKVNIKLQQEYNCNLNQKGPFIIQSNLPKGYQTFVKSGHWNDKEKLKYVIFLERHHEKLARRQNRRLWKVFKAMSEFIKTRNSNQCRSHHQKMEKQYNSVKQVLEQYRQKYFDYDQRVEHYQKKLDEVQFNIPNKLPDQQEQENIDENDDNSSKEEPQNIQIPNIVNQSKVEQEEKIPMQQITIQQKQLEENIYSQLGKNKNLPPTDASYEPNLQLPQIKSYHLKDKLLALQSNNRPQYYSNPYQIPINPSLNNAQINMPINNINIPMNNINVPMNHINMSMNSMNMNHMNMNSVPMYPMSMNNMPMKVPTNNMGMPMNMNYMNNSGIGMNNNMGINLGCNPSQINYSFGYDTNMNTFLQKQWIDCHQKFTAWITKLHKLVVQSETQNKF